MLQKGIFAQIKAVLVAVSLLVAGMAWADPPGRAVRLAYATGAVSFLPAGENDWLEARVNRPLWIGDRLWAGQGARAELQFGNASVYAASDTSASILNFDDRRAQFELTQGTLVVQVRTLDGDDTIEVDTPNLALVLRRPGAYRIDVAPDGDWTAVAVIRGEAEAFGTQTSYLLRGNERYRFRGTDLADFRRDPVRTGDAFDRWVAERVRYAERSASARYVSTETIGYADLDAHGTWRTVASYGPVWVPSRVEPDWAPYRYGHWAWVDPWGWTWIDDAPWGFAPFHYGRWAYVDDRYWAWVPGPRKVRPVYAPALVAFVGGGNVNISVGLGSGVAWFPLAPGEVYRPAYTASRDYFTRVNVTNTVVNVTNMTNVYNNPAPQVRYVNVTNVNAVTAVPAQTFAQSQPVHRAKVRVDARQLSGAQVVAAAPVAPTQASIAGTPRAAAKPAPQVTERLVVAKQPPPPAPPSIERRQEAMRQQPGKPLDRAELERLAPTAAASKPRVRVVEASAPARPIATAAPQPAAAPPQEREQRAKQEPQRPTVAAPTPEAPKAEPQRQAVTAPPQEREQRGKQEPQRPTVAAPAPQAPKVEPQRQAVTAPAQEREQRGKQEPQRPTVAAPAPEAPKAEPQRQAVTAPPQDREQRGKQEPQRSSAAAPAPEAPRAEPPRQPMAAPPPESSPAQRETRRSPASPPPAARPPEQAAAPRVQQEPPAVPPPQSASPGRGSDRNARTPPGRDESPERGDKDKGKRDKD